MYVTRTVKVRARIEKDATVAVFASSALFFICFPSDVMKNVTKKHRLNYGETMSLVCSCKLCQKQLWESDTSSKDPSQ